VSARAKFLTLILMLARIGVGLCIISAGLKMAQGEIAFTSSEYDSTLTGAFVVLIGAACIILAIFPQLFGSKQ
jgi:hypothetical protein